MKFIHLSFLVVAIVASTAALLQADCGNHCCLCGKKVCVLKVSEEKEDVSYFEVESKEICIPGIKLPWSCKRMCGGVRKVCVLKEEKREATVCKYDWTIKTICTSCCKKHGFQHGRHVQIQRDKKVPFEYYAADLDAEVDLVTFAAPKLGHPRTANARERQGTRPNAVGPTEISVQHQQAWLAKEWEAAAKKDSVKEDSMKEVSAEEARIGRPENGVGNPRAQAGPGGELVTSTPRTK